MSSTSKKKLNTALFRRVLSREDSTGEGEGNARGSGVMEEDKKARSR